MMVGVLGVCGVSCWVAVVLLLVAVVVAGWYGTWGLVLKYPASPLPNSPPTFIASFCECSNLDLVRSNKRERERERLT